MEQKFKATKRAGILGMLGNLFLLIIKATIGFATKSQAMIADAINSASDIFASLMTFIGNKISSEPRDETHNFGHGKAEYIFSLFISITMMGLALKILLDSILSLINQNHFEYSIFLIIVCIITILVKFSLFIYTRLLYKKHNNILLKSNYEDHRNDCLLTSLTLLSIVCGAFYNIYWVDGVIGTLISVWIFISGLKIFIESFNVLMDVSLDPETKEYIIKLVNKHDNIINCHQFYAKPIGYHYLVIFTIVVDGNMSTYESHALAEHLEKEISENEKIEKVIIHVDPV